MNNLLLYIQETLQCTNIIQLLQHAWVEGDTVYVLDKDYHGVKYDTNLILIIDAIIHNTFKCQYFKIADLIGESPTYIWNNEKKNYIFFNTILYN